MAVPVIEHHTTALKGDSSASSISVSHTGTGSDLLAVVCLSHRYGADAITGVTYGGNAMTDPDGGAGPQAQRDAIGAAMEHVADLVAAGHDVVLTHGNGQGAVWDIDPESWERRACTIANRALNHDIRNMR